MIAVGPKSLSTRCERVIQPQSVLFGGMARTTPNFVTLTSARRAQLSRTTTCARSPTGRWCGPSPHLVVRPLLREGPWPRTRSPRHTRNRHTIRTRPQNLIPLARNFADGSGRVFTPSQREGTGGGGSFVARSPLHRDDLGTPTPTPCATRAAVCSSPTHLRSPRRRACGPWVHRANSSMRLNHATQTEPAAQAISCDNTELRSRRHYFKANPIRRLRVERTANRYPNAILANNICDSPTG